MKSSKQGKAMPKAKYSGDKATNGSANIVGRLTKHVNALLTVESAIFAGEKTTFYLFVYKTNQ